MAFTDVGNAGITSGGVGDVLSDIIVSMMGQQLALFDAACAGCVAHGATADTVAARYMRHVVNRFIRAALAVC